MSLVVATALGLLFAAGTYLMLRRDAVRVVLGSLIISQAANIYLMTMGGGEGGVPILSHGGGSHHVTDPVPQALVLTAIVIGFATTAFLLSLTYRFYEENEEVDLDSLRGELL
ncbi:sodium:proton antiporter [Candidatus Nanosalina sp. VS9-1]|uniref:sodium:proton antiporter n=1 Tax=Candidatus Nanosalina sp. VS9-1 TaxID=3388566 RepID=UPI0039E1741B